MTPARQEMFRVEFSKLEALETGWAGPASPAISREILSAVKTFLENPMLPAWFDPRIVPTPSGRIQLEQTRRSGADKREFELEFISPETISYLQWAENGKFALQADIPASDLDTVLSLIQWLNGEPD